MFFERGPFVFLDATIVEVKARGIFSWPATTPLDAIKSYTLNLLIWMLSVGEDPNQTFRILQL